MLTEKMLVTLLGYVFGTLITLFLTRDSRRVGNGVLQLLGKSFSGDFSGRLGTIRYLQPSDPLLEATVRILLSRTNLEDYRPMWDMVVKKGSASLNAVVLSRWDMAWTYRYDRKGFTYPEGSLNFCALSHSKNPGLATALNEILDIENLASKPLNFSQYCEIADLAREFILVQTRAVMKACEVATKSDEVHHLLNTYPDQADKLDRELYTRLAELEDRSDYLSVLLGKVRVGSDAWKIAMAKLNSMPDPSMETSGSYGFP